MKRRDVRISVVLAVLLGTWASLSDHVGFRFPVAFDNDPLREPVHVTRISEKRIVLQDGRTFELEPPSGTPIFPWIDVPLRRDRVVGSKYRVDVELLDDGQYAIFVSDRGTMCATMFMRDINIPLIPVDYPVNRRHFLAKATLMPQSPPN